MLEQHIGGVMRRRAETADGEPLAFEIFELVDAFARKDNLIVVVLHGGDEHEVVTLQARLDNRTDVNDRRITGDQSLGRHLSAAQEDRLDLKLILGKESHFSGNPNIALTKTERRVADANSLQGLRLGINIC